MSQLESEDNEINMSELFAAVWHSWWIVVVATLVSGVLACYYAFVIKIPEYKASTRFELLTGDDGGGALGQFSSLAAMAGINLPNSISEAETIEDRILSRPFVDSIYEEAGFSTDPVFNGRLQEPGVLSRLRTAVLGSSVQKELDRVDYLVMAIGALRKVMVLSPGDNGIIELTITHPKGERAAKVANVIVERSLLDIFERKRNGTRESLSYFADELLQVRANLDAANAAVRDYAISNSLQSAEELTRTSSQLSKVRRDIEVIDNSLLALHQMNNEEFSGSDFAQLYPVSTNLSFRRLFNFSGDPSSWEKPSSSDLERAKLRLEAQIPPLMSSLNALQARAKSAGEEALKLAALEREVEVQQAIYESVITQFEAQSLISGYERASGRIIESAIAPNVPSSPKKPLLVMLGLVLGVFLGAAIALVISLRRGVLYTEAAMKREFAFTDLRRRNRSQLGKVNKAELNDSQLSSAQDLCVSIHKEAKIIAVVPTRPGDLGARLALSFVKASSDLGENSAIVDLSNDAFGKLDKGTSKELESGFRKYPYFRDMDLLTPLSAETFMNHTACETKLDALKSSYDRVVVVLPPPQRGTAVTRAVARMTDAVIVVAETARTNRMSAEEINSVFSRTKCSSTLLVIV